MPPITAPPVRLRNKRLIVVIVAVSAGVLLSVPAVAAALLVGLAGGY